MDERLIAVQALIAALTVAAALATPRIQGSMADAREAREARLDELDRFASRVRALSKRIQSELVFPHLASLKTVEPVHDLLYVSPDLNPDIGSLNEMLRIGQRARELNYGPKQLLLWTWTFREREQLVRQLVVAETTFMDSYWRARAALDAPWRLPRKLRGTST